MKHVLLVFFGGGAGSVARYFVGRLFNYSTSGFPIGTFLVNVIGSIFIGIIFGFLLKNNTISENTTLFLATGFCGGFTTFSAFALENQVFLKNGDYFNFILYTLTSIVLGFTAVFFGLYLSKLV